MHAHKHAHMHAHTTTTLFLGLTSGTAIVAIGTKVTEVLCVLQKGACVVNGLLTILTDAVTSSAAGVEADGCLCVDRGGGQRKQRNGNERRHTSSGLHHLLALMQQLL